MRKLHLSDLSRYVGYSKTLCSMVLNGKGDKYGISKKTQEEVMSAAKKLCYTPQRFASALRVGKSFFIGMIVTDISDPFFAEIVRSIESKIQHTHYNLLISCTYENEEREKALVEMMLGQVGVDGLIIASTFSSAGFYAQTRFASVHTIFIDRIVPQHPANYVVIDNFGGALEAVDKLFKEGCRHIACFTTTPSHLSTLEDRMQGYRTALRNNGVYDVHELTRTIDHENVEADIEKTLLQMIDRGDRIDAIFVLTAKIAFVLIKMLRRPEFSKYSRLKLACFDNLEMYDFINRKVISVSQPVWEMGQEAGELMVELLSGKHINKSYKVLSPKLIER